MRVHALNRIIRNLIDPAAMARGTEEALSRLMQSEGEQDRLQHESCLLEASRAEIHVLRQIVEQLLGEMREPLTHGTLVAQRAILQTTVDRK